MSEVGKLVISLLVVGVISIGIFALFPQTRKGFAIGVIVVLGLFTFLNVLGSALVGPVDLRAMLVVAPMIAFYAVIWFLWKIKRIENAHG